MTLDELVNSIPIEELKLKENLSRLVDEWKKNDLDVDKLEYLIGKWHGNVWFKDTNVSNEFYKHFTEFKKETIQGIHGMTLNERLYSFSLFKMWDSNNSKIHNIIRMKLKAA